MRSLKMPSRSWSADYGAGGGNFIGVVVAEGVGGAGVDSDGDNVAVGASVAATLGRLCLDGTRVNRDDMARRSLENGISGIRTTSIGTTTAATAAHLVQRKILRP